MQATPPMRQRVQRRRRPAPSVAQRVALLHDLPHLPELRHTARDTPKPLAGTGLR
jgi:hypothetical protein